MKKIFGTLVLAMLLVAMVPMVSGLPPAFGGGIGVNIGTTSDPPKVYMDPNTRILYTEPEDGRVQSTSRSANYAFVGEQVQWSVLAYDRNGIEEVDKVRVLVTDEQVSCDTQCIEGGCEDYSCEDGAETICGINPEDYVEVMCVESGRVGVDPLSPEDNEGHPLAWDALTMRWYTCTLTVEDWEGEYWIVAAANDNSCLWGTFDENEYWYFNPSIELSISDSELDFGNVIPGTRVYSQTILVSNEASPGSGVQLRAGISGYNLFDSSSSNARCHNTDNVLEDSNELALTNFAYYATMGSYSTRTNVGLSDSEGYDAIPYEDGTPLIVGTGRAIGRETIIDANQGILPEGGDIALTFRLDMPKPCIGTWDTGMGPNGEFIMFWAEAV